MACDLTSGFSVGCSDSIGGVAEFWISKYAVVIWLLALEY